MITKNEALDLYIQWLKGASLRELAPSANVSHPILRKYFRAYFGSSATDPTATSMARSLLADYPDDPEMVTYALELALGTKEVTKHRSNHNMSQLSKFQVVREPELMDYLVSQEGVNDPWETLEPEEPLRLSYVLMWLQWLLGYLDDLVD